MGPRGIGSGGARQRVERALAEAKARSRSPPPLASGSPASAAPSPAVRGSGGAKQRAIAAARRADPHEEAVDSTGTVFANHVYKLFLRNKFSGKDTIALARHAQAAGVSGVSKIASSASAGKHMQNACRDIMSHLLKSCTMPEL